ncbi:MAG: RNA pseudouridine synthase, partial [Alphaproteobacteria bacterium]
MEKKTFNISVPIDSHRDRIDKFLQSQLSELSRTRLQNLIRNGHVKLNNAIINEVSKKIKNEDKIEVNFPQPKETLIKPNK